ncbi:hypothetical protein [Actinomadura sp. NPDC048394]|uniref:hypothetical protein n=1 Tax=Actinomadura sp. NPDC048394 TaxID=3158223 RepID=UPI003401AE82
MNPPHQSALQGAHRRHALIRILLLVVIVVLVLKGVDPYGAVFVAAYAGSVLTELVVRRRSRSRHAHLSARAAGEL